MDYLHHAYNDRLPDLYSLLEMQTEYMRQTQENCCGIENVDSSINNFLSCVYCGDCHLYGHCPYSTSSHVLRDDFTRNQTYFNYPFYPSESLQQQEPWDFHSNYFSEENFFPFHSHFHVEDNTFECKESSHLEKLLKEIERFSTEQQECATRVESYMSRTVSFIETTQPDTSSSIMFTSCVNDDYCEEVGDVEPNSSVDSLALTDESHKDFVDFSTVPDECLVDFVGCSKFLETPRVIGKDMHVVISLDSVNAYFLKLSMIDESQVINLNSLFFISFQTINLNDLLFCLKSHCLKRNEDKIIMVFDTHD